MSIAFPLGATVRFKQHRLSTLTPRDRRGLEGRIGTVQTDGNLVKKPTVYFPAVGGQLDLRLFRVEPGHLELVESPPDIEVTPLQAVGENQTTPDGSSNLSQSEMDDLFE